MIKDRVYPSSTIQRYKNEEGKILAIIHKGMGQKTQIWLWFFSLWKKKMCLAWKVLVTCDFRNKQWGPCPLLAVNQSVLSALMRWMWPMEQLPLCAAQPCPTTWEAPEGPAKQYSWGRYCCTVTQIPGASTKPSVLQEHWWLPAALQENVLQDLPSHRRLMEESSPRVAARNRTHTQEQAGASGWGKVLLWGEDCCIIPQISPRERE